MNDIQLHIIGEIIALSKTDLFDQYARILALDNLWTAHSGEFTQEVIDEVAKLLDAGVTPTDLANVVYTLKMEKSQIDTIALNSFIMMASLSL